jgi:hypothetical protein
MKTEFRDFASNFVPWYRIPSIFLLCGTVRNGIPRVFCSAEQPTFRRNKPIVPSIPSSAEYFFCCKLPTLSRSEEPTCYRRCSESLSSLAGAVPKVLTPNSGLWQGLHGSHKLLRFLLSSYSECWNLHAFLPCLYAGIEQQGSNNQTKSLLQLYARHLQYMLCT